MRPAPCVLCIDWLGAALETTKIMDNRKLIDGVLSQLGAQISSAERSAVADVLRAGELHGYGNMIAWLATAWAASFRAQGIDAKPEDFAGGRGYPLPKTEAPNARDVPDARDS